MKPNAKKTKKAAKRKINNGFWFDGGDTPFKLDFHPFQHVVAVGMLSGQVSCYRHDSEATEQNSSCTSVLPMSLTCWPRLFASTHHQNTVSSIKFDAAGNFIYSASSDKSLQVLDFESKSVIIKKGLAHDHAISAMIPAEAALSNHVLVSGDDSGYVKVWDLKSKTVVMSFKPNSETITDFCWIPDKDSGITGTADTLLAASSLDGTITVHDLRNTSIALEFQTPTSYNDEILCLAHVKAPQVSATIAPRRSLLCGMSNGQILTHNSDDWDADAVKVSARLGAKVPVECLAKFRTLDSSRILVGSELGDLRIIDPFASRSRSIIYEIGNHDESLPVTAIAVSFDDKFAASAGHDGAVRFWNLPAPDYSPDFTTASAKERPKKTSRSEFEENQKEEGDPPTDNGKVSAKEKKKNKKSKDTESNENNILKDFCSSIAGPSNFQDPNDDAKS